MANELEISEDFREIAHLKKRAFLAAFAKMGTAGQAAAAAGVCRRTHEYWLVKDEAYATAFRRAQRAAGDALEHEARKRAFKGSDTLLIFLIKAHDPSRFNDRLRAGLDGPQPPSNAPEVHVHIDFGKLSDDEIRRYREAIRTLDALEDGAHSAGLGAAPGNGEALAGGTR